MNLLIDRVRLILSEHPELEGDEGQLGLAKAAGASKSVVNQWLSGGIKSMDIKYALKIEEALGYSHIWLMTNMLPIMATGKTVAVAQRPPQWMDAEAFDLLELYYRGDKEARAAIKLYAGDMVGAKASMVAGNQS